MKLKHVKDWKAVHFPERTILKSDLEILHPLAKRDFLELEVEEGKYKGHYYVKDDKNA